MQARLNTQPYDFFDPVFDDTFEAPIDTEYNLPDYCPDIQKILKCQVQPQISSYMIADDTLTCDGVCDIRVLYLDSKGDTLRCCDFTKDFTATVKVKSSEEKAVAWVKATAEHITCRAVSARRIDLHIAVSIKALAVVQKQLAIADDIDDATIEKQCKDYTATQAVNALSHQFTVEDTLLLKNGKPPIEAIIRKNALCRVTSHRLTDGRLTVNGTTEISFLYISAVDGTTVEKMSSSIDFTQEIDCNGADDACICNLKACVGECTLQPVEDDVGEYTAVNAVVKIFVSAFLYKPCEITAVDDAYSVCAPLELKYSQTALLQVSEIHTEVLKKKCAISIAEDDIEKILDIWCEQASVQSSCDKGKLSYRVRCAVCVLYKSSSGRIFYTEKPVDFNTATELNTAETLKTETDFLAELWEYRITDKTTVEVSIETPVSTLLYSRQTVRNISFASTAESTEYTSAPGITVYYASAGESLWDIAKAHRAELSQIRTQNDVYDDFITDARPIIICNR